MNAKTGAGNYPTCTIALDEKEQREMGQWIAVEQAKLNRDAKSKDIVLAGQSTKLD